MSSPERFTGIAARRAGCISPACAANSSPRSAGSAWASDPDRVGDHGPARKAGHQPVHHSRIAAGIAGYRHDHSRRSARRAQLASSFAGVDRQHRAGRSRRAKRLLLVIGLCVGFRRRPRRPRPAVLACRRHLCRRCDCLAAISAANRPARALTLRQLIKAAAIGLGAGLIITLVFQEIFLVRLP